MKFTDKNAIDALNAQIAPRIAELADGKSANEIAVEIYMTLPNKSQSIAEMMSDEVSNIIENYHSDVDKSLADEDAFIQEKLAEAVKNAQSPIERCRVYHRVLVSLAAHALYAEGGEDAEEKAKAYLAENSEFSMTEDEAASKEAEMHDLAAQALANSEIISAQLPNFIQIAQEVSADSVSGFAAFGRKSSDIKLVLSMQAYVNAQNGLYEDMSADTTLEQIVYNVCAAMDTVAVAGSVESGELSESVAIKLLRAIGIAAACLATVALAVFYWAFTIISVFLNPFIGMCLVALGFFHAYCCGKDDALERIKNYSDAMARIGYTIGAAANCVVEGLKKLWQWVAPRVSNAIAWVKDKVFSAVATVKAGTQKLRERLMHDRAASEAAPEAAPAAEAEPVQTVMPNSVFA